MILSEQAVPNTLSQGFVEHCYNLYEMDHGGYHGFDHWMRVLHNGQKLAEMENANLQIVELFCLLHDTQRHNEKRDPEHGARAADYAHSIQGKWFDLSSEDMELLDEALRYHSDGYTEADITVQVCWDADRLDLVRVGIKPVAHRLCTNSAQLPEVLEAAYQRSLQ